MPPTETVFDYCAGFLKATLGQVKRPALIGVGGPQGSGKSTLVQELREWGENQNLRIEALSLDDFYLTRAQRRRLARELHPLFSTRGVPGTHDTALLSEVLDALVAGRGARAPRFDKASDERVAASDYHSVPPGALDVILVEGWCVGLAPERPADLERPINRLELEQDPHAVWRTRVNDELAGRYRQLFERFDRLVALVAPSFEVVLDWRRQQERALMEKLASANATARERPSGIMQTDAQLVDFISHFERLTRHGLTHWPKVADLVLFLDEERGVRADRQRLERARAPAT